MEKWDVVIIGAGFSGLCAGALLAKKGKEVLILEKDNTIGGLARSIDYQGQALDDGAHMPARVGHLENVFSEIGIPFPEYSVVNKAEIFHEGQWTNVKEIFPAELYKEAMEIIMNLTAEELSGLDDLPLNEWVEKITDNHEMKKLFFYFGCVTSVGNRFNTYSAGEMLYILREIIDMGKSFSENGGVIKGGMNKIAEPLSDFIESRGGEVRLNAPVDSLVIKDNRAVGVNIETGERLFRSQVLDTDIINAETVIITLPIWDIFHLLDESQFPGWWVDWIKWLSSKVSHVWSIIYSLNEPAFDPNTFRWIDKMPFSDNAGIFFHMPDYAMEGRSHQFHSCYQGHYDEFPDLFNMRNANVKNNTRETIEMLERETFELFPHVRNTYNWKISHAAVYGIAQSPGFVGDKRPSMIPPGVSNLYLVSGTVKEARGIGIAATAKCAQKAVDSIVST